MRNSILIIAIAVFTFLNVNAANKKMTLSTSAEVAEIIKDHITKVYDWSVKTDKGVYKGTSPNTEHANTMIAMVCRGEFVIEKEIVSFYVPENEAKNNEKRNYFWEVETATGYAKGYASTEDYAHKMIALVASGEVIMSKIIFSQPRQ
ncbi:hypothetical protein [Sinomicrobium sp. M5D2P17]